MFTVTIGDLVPGNFIQPAACLFNRFGIAGKLVEHVLQNIFSIFIAVNALLDETKQLFTEALEAARDIFVSVGAHCNWYGQYILHLHEWRRFTLDDILTFEKYICRHWFSGVELFHQVQGKLRCANASLWWYGFGTYLCKCIS